MSRNDAGSRPDTPPGRWTDGIAPGAAVLFAALVVAGYLHPPLTGQETNPAIYDHDGWWLSAGLVAAAALSLRRMFPLAVTTVIAVLITFVALGPYDVDPIAWTIYVAVFALGRYASLGRSVAGLTVFAVSSVPVMLSDQDFTVTGWVFAFGFVALAWMAGREVRRWRDRADLEKERAEQRVVLERQATQLAVTEERLHIAQELHDVMAHSMSLIAVQAEVADATFEAKPDEARKAVANVLHTSRSSLGEIRRILGILRNEHEGDVATDIAPVPGLSAIPRLVAATEETGLDVAYHGPETAEDVPPGVQLSIYRIAQEALTNVVEHAAATRATVTVECGADEVRIEIVDNGRGSDSSDSHPGGGYGLVGMRERVVAFDGDLQVGPTPGGGFSVAATIPYSHNGGAVAP